MHFTQALLAISAIAGLTLAAPQPAEVLEAKRAADAPPDDNQPRPNCPVWSTTVFPLAECQTGIYGPQRVDHFSTARAEGCQNLDSLDYGTSLKFDGQGVWTAQVFKDKDCTGGSWTYVDADDSRCLDIDQIKSFSVKVQQGKSLPPRCGGYQ